MLQSRRVFLLIKYINLGERILVFVEHTLRLVERNVFYAEVIEDGVQCLAHMGERHRTMMRITLGQQHMAIETAHLRDGEHTDAAEGTSSNRQNLALGDVSGQTARR